METKGLISHIYDKIVIYKDDGKDGFIDLYKGTSKETPSEMLGLNVISIGAKRKGIIDIHVS